MDEYVSFALALITDEQRCELQNSTLSRYDRLDRDYEAYVAEHGMIAKDEYLVKRLDGEIAAPRPTINGNA